MRAFGTREDLAILLFLGSVDSAEKRDIVSEVEMAPMTVHRHLLELEEMGLITVDIEMGRRQGRHVRYSLDRQETAIAIDRLRAALLGDLHP